MSETAIILRELKKLQDDMKFLKTLIAHNAGAAFQAKWVYKDEAMAITGLKETALMDRQITVNRKNELNKKGIFRISKTGKRIRFYRLDLEKFVLDNSNVNSKN